MSLSRISIYYRSRQPEGRNQTAHVLTMKNYWPKIRELQKEGFIIVRMRKRKTDPPFPERFIVKEYRGRVWHENVSMATARVLVAELAGLFPKKRFVIRDKKWGKKKS